MSAKANLLRSVSVAAILLAGTSVASAEFANGLPEYYFSAEGGLIVTDPAITVDDAFVLSPDKVGAFDLDESLGGYGGAQFGMFATSNID